MRIGFGSQTEHFPQKGTEEEETQHQVHIREEVGFDSHEFQNVGSLSLRQIVEEGVDSTDILHVGERLPCRVDGSSGDEGVESDLDDEDGFDCDHLGTGEAQHKHKKVPVLRDDGYILECFVDFVDIGFVVGECPDVVHFWVDCCGDYDVRTAESQVGSEWGLVQGVVDGKCGFQLVV